MKKYKIHIAISESPHPDDNSVHWGVIYDVGNLFDHKEVKDFFLGCFKTGFSYKVFYLSVENTPAELFETIEKDFNVSIGRGFTYTVIPFFIEKEDVHPLIDHLSKNPDYCSKEVVRA